MRGSSSSGSSVSTFTSRMTTELSSKVRVVYVVASQAGHQRLHLLVLLQLLRIWEIWSRTALELEYCNNDSPTFSIAPHFARKIVPKKRTCTYRSCGSACHKPRAFCRPLQLHHGVVDD